MPRPSIAPATGRLATLLSLALLSTLLACDEGAPSSESHAAVVDRLADVLPVVVPTDAPVPTDRAGILRELAPLPSESLLVVYAIEGPGGMTGSLEVLARPGGFRRENWSLTVPLGPEGERRVTGSTVQTPDGVWIEDAGPRAWSPSPLGALADAYLELDAQKQRAVVETLRTLRGTLAEARDAEPTPSPTVLDIPCHPSRIAATQMCVWEATGLPLRYRSEGLKLDAINVDTGASLGDHAFDVPALPSDAEPPIDARAALERLVEGELVELAPLLHPGLRLIAAS